jgi:hypothetical protein
MSFGWNLPPGVRESDIPGWNDPDPESCECGEDVYPGDDCAHCGAHAPSEEERREAYLEDHAEELYEMSKQEDW